MEITQGDLKNTDAQNTLYISYFSVFEGEKQSAMLFLKASWMIPICGRI